MVFDVSGNVVRYAMGIGGTQHFIYALVIPEKLPPSFNDLIQKSYEWTKNQRRWWQHFMSRHCKAVPTVYLEKRAVRIDLFKKGQADDAPNLDGRSKCILDSMKQLGMIVDDNAKYLDWGRVWQRKAAKGADCATVILLSETLESMYLMECHDLAPHALSLIVKD